jgi:hypothetical protein
MGRAGRAPLFLVWGDWMTVGANAVPAAHAPRVERGQDAGRHVTRHPGIRHRCHDGLPALQRLFENMPSAHEMAFVVILHLSPRHPSSAAAILQRATRMPVVQVTSRVQIEPGHVYVITPNVHLTMMDGLLIVEELQRPRGQHVGKSKIGLQFDKKGH